MFLDLALNPEVDNLKENNIKQKLIHDKIIDCQQISLLEGCRLSPSIFAPNYNKYYANVKTNLKRGGEDYIQPHE